MTKFATILTVFCLAARVAFGDVWQDLAKYKYGGENTADKAEQLLQQTPLAQHGAIEGSLIAVVAAKDATQDGKACACRMLQQIGTEKCIPAVTGLLNDEVLSHYARLVLERMGTPKADEAMRTALDGAPDKVKIGIIGSLGERRDVKAVKPLVKLTVHNDPTVAAAAISALGRIGGDSAAQCLRKLKPMEPLAPVHMIALLDCARSLKGSAAVALYELVLAGKTTQRIGALSGLLAVDEKRAVALMVDFIKGDDAQMSDGVLTLVSSEKSERLTKAMAEVLGTLQDEKKAALITVLGVREDAAALSGIAGCLASTNNRVRDAAVVAAGKIGDEGTVKLLLGMSGAAPEAIARMSGSGVNDLLINALDDNKLKVPAINALVARNCVAGVARLFQLLNDGNAEVRNAAWNGLGSLATEADIVPLVKAAFAIKEAEELAWGVAAARNVCAHARAKDKCFEVIVAYYDGTTDAAKATIVELAALVGSPSAMAVVKKALNSGNKELRRNGVRSLAAWCNEGAVGELLGLAKDAPEETDRILALRGYIRLASEGPNLNEEQRAEMFKQAAGLAKRVDEKKLIAGNLRRAPNAVALVIANTYLDDPAVVEEVEQSAVDIIGHLHNEKKGPPDVIKEVANKLLASKNTEFVDRAKRILAEMAK